jgi:hypothetical protein
LHACCFRPCKLDAVDIMAVLRQVQHHIIHLLLCTYDCGEFAKRKHCCLMQPAVGPCCTEQAVLVSYCTALQHCSTATRQRSGSANSKDGADASLAILCAASTRGEAV